MMVIGKVGSQRAPAKVLKYGCAAIAFVAGVPAVAAQAPPTVPNSASGDEIIVTAQKRSETLKNVPISISVLNGNALTKSTAQGVIEELAKVPGVAINNGFQGGVADLSVRGVAAPAGAGVVGFYLDTVPFGLVESPIVPDTGGYDLERVEVLRGPQGTLYGANALAGVIRIISRDANLTNLQFGGRVSGSSTEYGGDNYRASAMLNIPLIDDKLAVRGAVDYQNLSGWIDKPNKKNANDARLLNLRFKVNAKPTEDLTIGLSWWKSHQNYGAPSLGNDQRTRNTTLAEPSSIDYDVYGGHVQYDFHSFTASSSTSYLRFKERDTLDYGTDYLGIGPYPLNEGYGGNVFSEEINLASQGLSDWRWTAGAIYRDAKDSTFQTVAPYATLDWTNRSKSYAIYGEITRLFLNNKLEFTVGGRYFHDSVTQQEDRLVAPINSTFGYYRDNAKFNSTTPRVVVNYHPSRNSTLYASFSQGFRSGLPQQYYSVSGVPGLAPVKPDKLTNYEVGAKGDLLDHLISFDAAVYYEKWKDVQQVIKVPFSGTYVFALVNGQSASGPGAEAGVTLHPARGLSLTADVAWNDLKVDTDIFSGSVLAFAKGERLNQSPKYTAGASADYEFPISSDVKGRLSGSITYTSKKSTRSVGATGPFVEWGDAITVASARFAVDVGKKLEFSLFADNINNWNGAVARNSAIGAILPYWDTRIRPRTVGLQAELKY
jgi:iron complex outermembrane recepter protein